MASMFNPSAPALPRLALTRFQAATRFALASACVSRSACPKPSASCRASGASSRPIGGDAIEVCAVNGGAEVVLPVGSDDANWEPQGLPPIEVIDGQHRLFAFGETSDLPDDFELPVVAYYGLDVGWQAYLFWSINVSPKKINPSHAYDLFPLLRTQDWLESVSAVRHSIRRMIDFVSLIEGGPPRMRKPETGSPVTPKRFGQSGAAPAAVGPTNSSLCHCASVWEGRRRRLRASQKTGPDRVV